MGDDFAAQDGSRWRIVSIEEALNELAARDLDAVWTVAPMD